MRHILIIAEEKEATKGPASVLIRAGYHVVFSAEGEAISHISENPPAVVLVAVAGANTEAGTMALLRQIKEEVSSPIMALVSDGALSSLLPEMPLDDFVVMPCDERELILRIKRLLSETNGKEEGKLVCGDLAMNLAGYEVSLSGKRIELTFKEYELLRFLMSNKGRVFTRESLMDRVWGYDYYGGDRTVDVHIRRLRSKIEDSSHSFIETVRNIGYRFRDIS